MNKLLLIIAFLISFLAQAQEETKFIVKEDPKEFYTEEYYVMKANKALKHGSYVKYKGNAHAGIRVLESGAFSNGLKNGIWEYFYKYRPWNGLKAKGAFKDDKEEGLWEYYFLDTLQNDVSTHIYSSKKRKLDSIGISINNEKKSIREIGYYQKGVKQEVWEYYCAPNILDQKYDHTAGKLLYDRKSNSVVLPGKENRDRPALFIGGNYKLINLLSESVNMSLLLKDSKTEKLTAKIIISKDGRVINYKIDNYQEKNILHKEVLRIIKTIPNTWIAQIKEGSPVESIYGIEVDFKVIHKDNNSGNSQMIFRSIN